jgi:3-methylcrotonyl-CoA carboxylase alpha subunit
MFAKILIANRGEIACRIIRTAKRMGVATVAVFSDVDAQAMHVDLADEAHHIGAAPARESYLLGERILQVALASGAEAIHPGYGFLAENAEFAAACAAAGIVFIGPPVEAIEAMGSKSVAKQIMSAAGVPLVPGYHEEDQAPERLRLAADAIGYPLLIKASAGGGGKGMRVVRQAEEFAEALEGAKRESSAAFSDNQVLLEKYLEQPRHVEIQVFADSQGNVIHLFERDCSIQRRHQKVIEEAPAPGLDEALRARMGAAAVDAAKAIGYVNAGTVEFLLDRAGSFYFMEMNTRLQVEHPVTEMITGQDLVEWQLRVASGENLPCKQEDLSLSGHAIEARVYAEDPARDFLPSIGPLRHLRQPRESTQVRVDSGVRQGDEVSIHYDPMIAKLIVWDHDRSKAVRRMRNALAEFQVVGVNSNVSFLLSVAAHQAFAAAELDTGFIERHQAGLFPEDRPASDQILALACLDVLLQRTAEVQETAKTSPDPFSPWHCTDGWRLNSDNHHVLAFQDGADRISVTVHFRQDGYLMELPGGATNASGTFDVSGDLCANLDGMRLRATVVRRDSEITILVNGLSHTLTLEGSDLHAAEQEGGSGRLTAPMPGKIVAVMVAVGDVVKLGTPLVVLEAMKMEHTIKAPADGSVASLPYAEGDMVSEGAELLSFEIEETTV